MRTIRHAARVLLLDDADRVLLFRLRNAATGAPFWITPGGGIEPGEDARTAATRELREETGRDDIALGPEIWHRRHVFTWHDDEYDQRERFFLARTARFDPDLSGATDYERTELAGWRWWRPEELVDAEDELAPRDLAARVATLLADGPPAIPVVIGD